MTANHQRPRQTCDVAGARALLLRRAGYDARSSLELARRGDLDLDRAVRLLGFGVQRGSRAESVWLDPC